MTDAKPIQIYMREPTLKKIKAMETAFRTNNGSEIVDRSIDIMAIILDAIKNGGKIYVRKSDGSQAKLNIPGVSE